MRVLVTGASGFVGSLLIPRLLQAGHQVVAFSRDPRRMAPVPAGVALARGDVISGEGLAHAMEGVQVAYYLVHSMERSSSASAFALRERTGARAFAGQARRSGVQRIVYLGGLLPRAGPATLDHAAYRDGAHAHARESLSEHLASRRAVEEILLGSVPGSVALRASIVIGARSRSFRLMVHLVERMPVLALPAWRRFRTQPIDARDIAAMLVSAATADVAGRTLDVGGPDVLSYGQMIERIAELMLVHRPAVGLGVSMTQFTGRLAAAIAGEQPELVVPLMGSLHTDLLAADHAADQLLDVTLHSFDSAVEHALGEWEAAEPLAAR